MPQISTPAKQKIIFTMKELLNAKSLNTIKVSDILQGSGVSHQTFYRHFLDKYDACEYACYDLLSSAQTVVGTNSSVKEHTICTLTIVKSNGNFFKHLLSDSDGIEILRQTMIHLSEDSINFRSGDQITNAWVLCLNEWCKTNFKLSIEDMYYKIISCYSVSDVIFDQELKNILEKYGKYTMEELNILVKSKNLTNSPQ